MTVKKNPLLDGSIPSTLFHFAVPFLAAGILQALYGAVDLYVVGVFCDSAAISAVSIGSQLMHTITGMVLGIATGGTVVIARYMGARDPKRCANSVGNLILLFIGLACILTPLFVGLVNPIVGWMNTPIEAVSEAQHYIRICSYGIPFIVGYNAVSAIFRGFGNSKTPLLFVIIACVVNIVFDFVLVGGFHMASSGAAYATILAQAISFLSALVYMRKKGLPVPFQKSDIHFDSKIVKGILIVGVPLAIQDALVNVSFLVITVIMNSLGLIASAAVGVAERLLGFAFLIPSSFAQAVATMSAQNIGAGQKERGWKTLWAGVGFSLISGVVLCGIVNVIPEVFTSIFSHDPLVVTAAGQYIRSYSIDCILVSFIFNINAYFSAYEHSMYSFVHSMLATFLIRIPATWMLSKMVTDSLYCVGFAAPAASLFSILISAGLLFHMRKNGQ